MPLSYLNIVAVWRGACQKNAKDVRQAHGNLDNKIRTTNLTACASVSCVSREMEPNDMAPVLKRFMISDTGSTSSSGIESEGSSLNRKRPLAKRFVACRTARHTHAKSEKIKTAADGNKRVRAHGIGRDLFLRTPNTKTGKPGEKTRSRKKVDENHAKKRGGKQTKA